MSTLYVTFPGSKRVDVAFEGGLVHTDQSPAHGGEGSAPEPFDLFLAALAACAGTYVLGFCQARGIATDGIHLTQENLFDEGKLREVKLAIDLPPEFPEKYVTAVRAAAAGCKIKKLLSDPPSVLVEAARRASTVRAAS
jgi:ribosomal protein S12 methylthiotransferase accessory factor